MRQEDKYKESHKDAQRKWVLIWVLKDEAEIGRQIRGGNISGGEKSSGRKQQCIRDLEDLDHWGINSTEGSNQGKTKPPCLGPLSSHSPQPAVAEGSSFSSCIWIFHLHMDLQLHIGSSRAGTKNYSSLYPQHLDESLAHSRCSRVLINEQKQVHLVLPLEEIIRIARCKNSSLSWILIMSQILY